MNREQLLAAGFSASEVDAYLGSQNSTLKAAGFSDNEISDYSSPPKQKRTGVSNLVRGAMQGLGTAGTSTIGAIGTLTGSGRLRDWADRSEAEMREFYDPQGRAGRAGEIGGRVLGEIGTGIVGGSLGVKAATKASGRVARALEGASRTRRAGATMLANAPIDVVQGAKEDEGFFLPGRAGAIAENVGITGVAGALLPAMRGARSAEVRDPMKALPPGQYEMGPATVTSRTVPETDPRRLLGSRSQGIVPAQGDLTGPAIPLTARSEDLTLDAAKASDDDIAKYIEARNRGVVLSRTGKTARRPTSIQRAMEEAEREWIAAGDAPSGVASATFPRSLRKMSDDDLRATANEWNKRLDKTLQEAWILDETNAIDFTEQYGTVPMGYKKAKAMMGTAEEGRKLRGFSEEQVGRLEELNLNVDDYRTWVAAQKRLPILEAQFKKLTAEMDRRGVSFVDEAMDFPFGANRTGAINPQLLGTMGGAALGGTVGGATSPEGEDAFGRVGRVLTGAAVGAGVGRAATRPRSVQPQGSPVNAQFPERTTPLTEPVTDANRYANIDRMTSKEPGLAGGLRETVADAVSARELGERLPPRGKEVLGRLREAESETVLRERVAELFGERPSDIVATTAQGGRIGREGLLKATEELLGVQATINSIGDRLRSGMVVDVDELALLNARRDVSRQQARDLFASISTQKTEMARDLASLRFGAVLSETPTAWADRLQEMAKRDLTGEELAKIELLAARRDLNGLTKLGSEVRKSTPWEKAVTLLKTSYLSSPASHMANLTGNAMVAAARQLKDIPATVFDIALSSRTGQRTKMFDPIARAQATARGARRGLDEAKGVMRGDLPIAQKFSEIRETNYDNAIVNLYTKSVFRALDATDRVFRNMAFSNFIDEQARVLARQGGLRGDKAEAFVQRVTAAPPMEMAAEAILAADMATFQQTGQLAQAALDVRRRLGKFGDVLFPFAKTPANIAAAIIDYSPLGVFQRDFKQSVRTLLTGPNATAQRRVVERLGEVSVGSGIIGLGFVLGMNDKMTGFFPADQRTRAKWEQDGLMEGSVQIGDEWVQVIRLSPIGNLLAIGGALADIQKGDAGLAASAVGAVAAPLSAVADLPMVQGVSNIAETVNPQSSPEQKRDALVRMGAGVVSGMIPGSGLMRSAQRAVDPVVRETRADSQVESVGRSVIAGTPLARYLPERVDALGQQVVRGGTWLERFASPVVRRTDLRASDPVRAALDEANVVVGKMQPRKGESPQDFATRSRFTGAAVEQAIEGALASPTYANAATMNVDRVRRGLVQAGVDVEGRDDDALRTAYRTLLLDRVISRAKTAAGRITTERMAPRAAQYQKALSRQAP